MMDAGGSKIQPLLRTNADGGELIRHGDGVRRGGAVHLAGAEGDVPTLPVPERRHRRPTEAQLRAPRGERRRNIRRHERRDAAAEDAGSEPPAAAGVSSNGNDGARSLEASEGIAGAIGQHFEGLAFRAFSAPVRFLSLSLSPILFLCVCVLCAVKKLKLYYGDQEKGVNLISKEMIIAEFYDKTIFGWSTLLIWTLSFLCSLFSPCDRRLKRLAMQCLMLSLHLSKAEKASLFIPFHLTFLLPNLFIILCNLIYQQNYSIFSCNFSVHSFHSLSLPPILYIEIDVIKIHRKGSHELLLAYTKILVSLDLHLHITDYTVQKVNQDIDIYIYILINDDI